MLSVSHNIFEREVKENKKRVGVTNTTAHTTARRQAKAEVQKATGRAHFSISKEEGRSDEQQESHSCGAVISRRKGTSSGWNGNHQLATQTILQSAGRSGLFFYFQDLVRIVLKKR